MKKKIIVAEYSDTYEDEDGKEIEYTNAVAGTWEKENGKKVFKCTWCDVQGFDMSGTLSVSEFKKTCRVISENEVLIN